MTIKTVPVPYPIASVWLNKYQFSSHIPYTSPYAKPSRLVYGADSEHITQTQKYTNQNHTEYITDYHKFITKE